VNCKNLIKIELNKNEIVDLPHNLGVICSKMKNLSLNFNKLVGLPNLFGVFLPSLELLELNHNNVKAFPKSLNHCTQLVEVHLADNPLED
jgi:Leucine-rich repeat (LRR) protein